MGLASGLQNVADKLTTAFGTSVSIRYVTTGVYNTTTGSVTTSNADTPVKGVLSDVNLREVNDLVEANDRRLLVAAKDLTIVPTTEDKVVIGSAVYQIIRVVTEVLQGSDITYELILRS